MGKSGVSVPSFFTSMEKAPSPHPQKQEQENSQAK
jgi:hypothetical protein